MYVVDFKPKFPFRISLGVHKSHHGVTWLLGIMVDFTDEINFSTFSSSLVGKRLNWNFVNLCASFLALRVVFGLNTKLCLNRINLLNVLQHCNFFDFH